jgi:hypothetical protein
MPAEGRVTVSERRSTVSLMRLIMG